MLILTSRDVTRHDINERLLASIGALQLLDDPDESI
jgi:hypothetical protein